MSKAYKNEMLRLAVTVGQLYAVFQFVRRRGTQGPESHQEAVDHQARGEADSIPVTTAT